MPLAPAHPAVVLPLQRLGLPLSALVAGAVAPDAAVYLPVPVSYATTHSGGGLVADVAIGLVLLGLWSWVVRDAVVDLVPLLRERVVGHDRLDRRGWLLAPIAVAVGASTHVLWDSCTHDWGFVVEGSALLRSQLGPLPVYSWLQHGSTAVGSVAVAAYGLRRLAAAPAAPRQPAVARPWLWSVPVPLAALVVGLLHGANAAVGAALLALLTVATAWRAARRLQPPASRT